MEAVEGYLCQGVEKWERLFRNTNGICATIILGLISDYEKGNFWPLSLTASSSSSFPSSERLAL